MDAVDLHFRRFPGRSEVLPMVFIGWNAGGETEAKLPSFRTFNASTGVAQVLARRYDAMR
ncbi:MAG: hypothetical protein P8L18_16770 [Verrucomicrobiota bacterium]|nr:hypothetical protein [Verrucomicrobiota bacterium]